MHEDLSTRAEAAVGYVILLFNPTCWQLLLAVGEPARAQSRVGQLVGKKKSDFGQVTRDDLITMVQHGEMTPADAESRRSG